jgi:hypothetical protein
MITNRNPTCSYLSRDIVRIHCGSVAESPYIALSAGYRANTAVCPRVKA